MSVWTPANSPLGPVPKVNEWLWELAGNSYARNRDTLLREQETNVLYAANALARAYESAADPTL